VDEVGVGHVPGVVTVRDDEDVPTAVTHAAEFDAFVASCGSRLLRTAYLLVGDAQAAEDLVQDTLLKVWSRWSRVRATDEPLAYVQRILVNTSASRWRAVRRRSGGEHLVAVPPEAAATVLAERDEVLWQAVAALPARQRAVVVLCYYEDLTDAATADALGCAVGTVKSQRAKALRTLRALLPEVER
jgi:RNA polymerase sigma-70 factor (sigma-E family)